MRELLNINLELIDSDNRYRQNLELDEDFLGSIREKGVIQPITVVRVAGGRYKLLAGGRRFAGARETGLATIPALVRQDEGNLDHREIEFLENAQRRDFTWQERLKLVTEIHRLMAEKHGEKGSQTATAKFLDKSVGGVHRILSLSKTLAQFPALAECATEDEAVRKARKIIESALVVQMGKKHKAEAEAIGVDPEAELEAAIAEQEAEIQRDPGEGFKEDPYVQLARRATLHYRIGDALSELQEMIDNNLRPNIKLVEVDPPYGIDLKNQKKGDETRELDRYEEIDKDLYPQWIDALVWRIDKVIPADCRIVFWLAQEWYQTVCDSFAKVGWNYDPIPCVWSKGSGQTNAPDLYLARTYEIFLVASKGEGVPIAQRGRSNVFTYPPVPPSRKYHPTQKPLELMDEILATFGWPGTILMCPFLGSGVTLRSAYRHSMLPFGWDKNDENKPKFLAAVEEDIQSYKVNDVNPETKASDIPF